MSSKNVHTTTKTSLLGQSTSQAMSQPVRLTFDARAVSELAGAGLPYDDLPSQHGVGQKRVRALARSYPASDKSYFSKRSRQGAF
ncbi:hypothetical protein [Vibrio sp. 10N.286.49.B3]|uniref:hypothetical protein n=1 Tax=Vibrio sp. 10N.286.49.B3 TaxID=1880855 RepID=UPI001055598B|nr:hypothetical protein [Vibrio sp. 10N.286.49.B3]